MFNFGLKMATLFKADVKTKMHRLMRHVDRYLIQIGCIRGV